MFHHSVEVDFNVSVMIELTDDLLLLQISSCVVWQTRDLHLTLSIPEAGETAETPVKRYCNTGKVPISTQKRPSPVRNYYFLVGYIHVFDKGNSAFGGK